jgi:hypothetical protein
MRVGHGRPVYFRAGRRSRSKPFRWQDVKTTRVTARSVISKRLKALNVSSGCTALFVLGRLRGAFRLDVWLRFTGFLGLWDFPISHAGQLFL